MSIKENLEESEFWDGVKGVAKGGAEIVGSAGDFISNFGRMGKNLIDYGDPNPSVGTVVKHHLTPMRTAVGATALTLGTLALAKKLKEQKKLKEAKKKAKEKAKKEKENDNQTSDNFNNMKERSYV